MLRLHTDAGVTGLGKAAAGFAIGAAGMIEDLVNRLIFGQDPFAAEHLWQEMYGHSVCAKGGGPVLNAAGRHLSASLPSVLIQNLHPFRHPDHRAYVDRASERDVRDGIRLVRDDPRAGHCAARCAAACEAESGRGAAPCAPG